MRALPCLVLLAACATSDDDAAAPEGEPYFQLDAELACAQPVVELEGGLHAHLLASTDGGLTFDYVPDRPLEARVTGSYDLGSGAVRWTRTYADPYAREEEQVTGTGTAYTNGDLDVEWDRKLVRRTGGASVQHERIVRTGCAQQRVRTTPSGEIAEVEEGTWGPRGYAYTSQVLRDGAKVELTGQLARDRTRTEHEAWRVGDHEYVADTVDDGQGKVVVTFREVATGTLREGSVTTRPNGSERHVYTETATTWTGAWDYGVDADGSGTGTVVIQPTRGDAVTCDVTVTDGDCRFTCPGESPSRC